MTSPPFLLAPESAPMLGAVQVVPPRSLRGLHLDRPCASAILARREERHQNEHASRTRGPTDCPRFQGNLARAQQALSRWLAYCADANIPELSRLARTSTPGGPSCWPTSTPPGCPTGPPKRSTC